MRRKAVEHLLECVQVATELGSTAQSLWFADGTNYPGQDDLRARRRRLVEALARGLRRPARRAGAAHRVQALRAGLLRDRPAGLGRVAAHLLRSSASARRCSSTSATTPRARTSSRSSRSCRTEERLGGFHFNNRKYADDDLIVGSVNPFELFLDLLRAGRRRGPAPAPDHRPVAQRRGEGGGDGAERRQPAGGLREGAARRPRGAGASARRRATCSRGHEMLLDAYNTDVRPLCARVREAAGGAADPLGELRSGAYARKVADAARGGRRHGRGLGPMSAPARPVRWWRPCEDRWPAASEVPDDALGQVLLASHLLGSDRAVANFGGGNTSAKGISTDHVGREVATMWVKGSGCDLATMEAKHFTPLRLDEMLAADRARRDDRRGHGRPPRALPDSTRRRRAPRSRRCCTRSCRPSTSTTPIPTASTSSPGPQRRRGADRGVLRRRGGVDPVHPAGLHARQAGRPRGARGPAA